MSKFDARQIRYSSKNILDIRSREKHLVKSFAALCKFRSLSAATMDPAPFFERSHLEFEINREIGVKGPSF